MTEGDAPDDRDMRLAPVVVKLLMCGAGYRSVAQLADGIGMNKATLSRAMHGHAAPGAVMIRAFAQRFPGLDITVLVRPVGDPLLSLGLGPPGGPEEGDNGSG